MPTGSTDCAGATNPSRPHRDEMLLLRIKAVSLTTRSITVGDRADSQALVRAVATTGLVAVIDDVVEFGRAKSAFERLRDGSQVDKLVIRIS